MPWQPAAAKALRSAWIPAPPPESEPAIVRHLGTNSLPSPVLTGSGSTGVISAAWAPRSAQGTVSHVTDVSELRLVLTVPDFDAALRFYRDTLGLDVEAVWSSEGGHVVLLSAGRATLELVDEAHAAEIDRIEVGRRVAGPVRVAFRVGDSDAVGAELE